MEFFRTFTLADNQYVKNQSIAYRKNYRKNFNLYEDMIFNQINLESLSKFKVPTRFNNKSSYQKPIQHIKSRV